MKTNLHNPLWTHLPALAVFIYFIVRLIGAGPLPAQAPVHYNWQGVPNSYGSPWLSIGLTLGLGLLFIVLSAVLDELWARHEKSKTFNWLSLFDEIVVGFLVGINAGYLDSLQTNSGTFVFPAVYVAVLAGGAILLAVVLELVRPFRPLPDQLAVEDTSGLAAELTARLKDSRPFLYWESQNPFYFALLSIVLPVIMLVGAILLWSSSPWSALVLFVVGVPFFLFYGGMRTIVLPQEIAVRFGLTGLKVLKIKTAEIAQAEIMQFAPLGDFGGYGIRFNGKMTAYYLRGSRGVKITTRKGKQYLIGSDNPEHLLTVINAVAKAA
jgi:hypothetical protein